MKARASVSVAEVKAALVYPTEKRFLALLERFYPKGTAKARRQFFKALDRALKELAREQGTPGEARIWPALTEDEAAEAFVSWARRITGNVKE
jgi:hypothetical protein